MNFKDTPFASIPKYCISLKRNQDRRDLVVKEFSKAHLDVNFFNALDGRELFVPELSEKRKSQHYEGIYGCMMSHLTLFKEARERGEKAICVFEDDIIVCDDFNERIKYIESLPSLEFDYFALGGHFNSPKKGTLIHVAETTKYPYIFKIKEKAGSYGYIITDKVMDFMIRNLTYNFGVDHFLGEHVYNRFTCKCFVPFLVGCRPCVSEISGTFWKYDSIDYYYDQKGIDFSKEYKSITDVIVDEEEKQKMIADAERDARLKAENY